MRASRRRTVHARGADQAWWQQALACEVAKERQQQVVGGAVDLAKCFDRLPRTLLYTLAKAYNMPDRVLQAYH